jgi:hypothetical protein
MNLASRYHRHIYTTTYEEEASFLVVEIGFVKELLR